MLETRAADGGQCVRCGRKLKDPVSLERGMGPVCWAQSQGDVFERDLEATEEEWARREHLLRHGGEIDLGCNWPWVDPEKIRTHTLVLPQTMRVSIRYNPTAGLFEAYGEAAGREVVVSAHADLRDAYRAAVNLG
ncbi:MAG: DUF6011 domain-containing protein, partial [Bacillota bacterium]|nr:DUF6011 domain-containing protein [Bacillota bacterium]